jgi:hypothetical protein
VALADVLVEGIVDGANGGGACVSRQRLCRDQFLLITILLAWDWLYPTEIQIVNTGLKPRVNHGVVSLPLVNTNGKRDHLYRSLPLVKTKR